MNQRVLRLGGVGLTGRAGLIGLTGVGRTGRPGVGVGLGVGVSVTPWLGVPICDLLTSKASAEVEAQNPAVPS
jgi:hypothetical protein